MSSIDSKCITNCDESQIDLSLYLNNNRLIQTPDIGHQLMKGLSLNSFLNGLIANVTNNPEKCDVWSEVLLDIIDNHYINETMLSEVLNITITKSKSHLIANRVFSCKMLAKLCLRLNENIFLEKVLPLVQYLCHDVQPSVRAHISRQLFVLSQNFSLTTLKTQILPLLLELSEDSDVIIRIASFESLIDLLTKLDVESNKQIVLPKIVMFFDTALAMNDSSLGMVFTIFGKLCQTLPKDVIAREKWFLDYYCNVFMISYDFQCIVKNTNFIERDIQCRNLLAFFFPILLQIYGSNDSLLSVLNFLCSDLDITVVRTIASVFTQINTYFKNPFKLYPQLSKILSQKSIIVSKVLIPFLSDLLIDVIKSTPEENKSVLFDDMITNLIDCENIICLNLDWRLQIKFYESMTQVMPYLPVNRIQNSFTPLLINRILTSRPIPVRIATSRCLIALFRDIPVLLEELNIYDWFVSTLCYGKSHSQRMLFLNVCELINELCDKHILISYFLEPLLSLRKDKVPNIRLNVCKKFKSFKHLLEVPDIIDRIEQIKQMFRQMIAIERDRDVIDSIKQLIEEFDWNSDFAKFEVEELAKEFDCLTIDGSLDDACDGVVLEVNNNSIDNKDSNSDKTDSIKLKSSLPQLIRSQTNTNTNSNTKCLPIIHINNSLNLIPSKIPKPITKSSK